MMPDDSSKPPLSDRTSHVPPRNDNAPASHGAMSWLKGLMRKKNNAAEQIQEALEDFIEELEESSTEDQSVIDNQKMMIQNVVKTDDMDVDDIMVPRADIVAIEEKITQEQLAQVFKENQFSRIPVYRETLDNIIGVLHIKDLLLNFLEGQTFDIAPLLRDVTIATPGTPIMDVFINMRQDKKHLAMVVDEHGGIDGLVTINDIIEAVMGDIEDEFDNDEQPKVVERPDGSLVVDGRFEIEDFEEAFGYFLTDEEREDVDTIGGLAFAMAGHVPKRGEVLTHECGATLEILEANASRVKKVRIRNLPEKPTSGDDV